MSSIRIFMPYTKGCYVPNVPEVVPILLNANYEDKTIYSSTHFIKDSDGENISKQFNKYGNFTMHYYAWKNEKADYIGFLSDNVFLNFTDKKYQTNDWGDVLIDRISDDFEIRLNEIHQHISNVVTGADIVVPKRAYLKKTIYEEYKNNFGHSIEDLDHVLMILKKHHPDMFDVAKRYCRGHYGFYNGVFVMKYDLFCKYSEWLFEVLQLLEKEQPGENLDAIHAKRLSFLAERLTGIFIEYCKTALRMNIVELQRFYIFDTQRPQIIEPVFKNTDCAVIMSSENAYVQYLSVALQSIIENSSSKKNYDIIILTRDINKKNRELLIGQAKDMSNFSIRFCNMIKYIEKCGTLPTHGQISIETYFRYFILDIFKGYEKILYLDADTVCNVNLSLLYAEDVTDYLLAAPLDIDAIGCYNGHVPARKNYVDTQLLIKDPYKYFQAGVILFNLREFQHKFTSKEFIDFSLLQHWEFLDQDVLNHFCQGHVKILDMKWDVMMDNAGLRKEIAKKAPLYMYEEYLMARRNPYIVHYAGWEKPWDIPQIDMGEYFWHYARLCPFYELLVLFMNKYQLNGSEEIVNNYYVDNKHKGLLYYIHRFFTVWKDNGFGTAARAVIRKLFKKK